MFYRINIRLAFTDFDPLNDLLEEARRRILHAHTINPGQPNFEQSHIIVERCYHDEDPPGSCTILESHFTPE